MLVLSSCAVLCFCSRGTCQNTWRTWNLPYLVCIVAVTVTVMLYKWWPASRSSLKIFCPLFVKCFPCPSPSRRHFTNLSSHKFSMMPVVICFVIPHNRIKKFKQKLFQQKSCDDFNVGRLMLPAWAALHICKCHGPIMCRYSALRYNDEY